MSEYKPIYKVSIKVTSGNGGNGCVSFRREKRVAKGGPNGGNGGKGGSIFLRGNPGMRTLLPFKYKKSWKAGNGKDGSSQNKTGSSAEDVYIDVPYGTEVWCDGELVADIVCSEPFKVAAGGWGGLGNSCFAAPDLTTPYISTDGKKGEEKTLNLVLKYMADVGVVGLPNAGKSTLVHELSGARVKIGDYAFSTIEPVLGTVEHEGQKIVFADLPGLIEGSHKNIALGHEFLQHLTRCKALLHLIDSTAEDALNDFKTVLSEVEIYDPALLLNKPHIVCLTKVDLIEEDRKKELVSLFTGLGYKTLTISQLDPDSIQNVVSQIFD